MLLQEVDINLCGLFLDSLLKYRAVDLSSRPHKNYAAFATFRMRIEQPLGALKMLIIQMVLGLSRTTSKAYSTSKEKLTTFIV